jgi:hypothetical protein
MAMKIDNLVHVAGKTDRKGRQYCDRCGEVIAEPPSPPFPIGRRVLHTAGVELRAAAAGDCGVQVQP